jgi:predicted PurR-regulated permease PerM
MLDYERLLQGFKGMVPPKYREVTFKIANDIKVSMNHYFRGQALVAFCVGVLFSIGFLIIKFPLAIVMGMFIGLLNMVPYLQLISFIPTTLLCVICSANADVSFWGIWGEMVAVYVVVQCIQDLILTPHIMGKSMGLNPAIILLSISIWGYLLGFIGLIVALPLTTLLLSYYNQYISRREVPTPSSEDDKS